MSQPIRGEGGHLVFQIGPIKNTNLVEGVEILLPVKFCWIPFSSFRGEVKNFSANQRRGRPSCFSNQPENASLVEDVEILLPVKFCWILFSGFRGKVENVSANYRPGRPFCISDPPEKHKLGRGCWDLASYQVLSNSFQGFQRTSWKCLSQSEARAAILFFPDWPEKHERGRRHWELASCQVLLNSVQRFLWKVENVSVNQRPGRQIRFFPIGTKNTNLVEEVEIFLPVKFRWIPFRGFRGEVENVSAN